MAAPAGNQSSPATMITRPRRPRMRLPRRRRSRRARRTERGAVATVAAGAQTGGECAIFSRAMAPLGQSRPLELLAPAKTADIGREAILHGADAVYIGGPSFGARDKAGNPMGEIARLVEFAHRFHARIYVTLNTILHDAELEPARAAGARVLGRRRRRADRAGHGPAGTRPAAASTCTPRRSATSARRRRRASSPTSGFSQIVLARELTIEEIAAVRAAVPADDGHRALRPRRAVRRLLRPVLHQPRADRPQRQPRRLLAGLPPALHAAGSAQGRVVAFDKHLLSLKDNNQSANLRALIDAGVRSFKIEGRYKDCALREEHHRPLPAAARRAARRAARSRAGLQRAHAARCSRRTRTRPSIAARPTTSPAAARPTSAPSTRRPSSACRSARVTRIGPDWIEIEASEPLANGDGLTYLHKREAVGLQANRAERVGATGSGASLWRVWPNEPMSSLARPPARTRRSSATATTPGSRRSRRPPPSGASTCARGSRRRAEGFALTLEDGDGIRAGATVALDISRRARGAEAEAGAARAARSLRPAPISRWPISTSRGAEPWFVPDVGRQPAAPRCGRGARRGAPARVRAAAAPARGPAAGRLPGRFADLPRQRLQPGGAGVLRAATA